MKPHISEIAHLNTEQLQTLRTAVDERINELRETGLAELRARFEEQAASFGLTAVVVINGGKKSKRKPRNMPKEE